MQFLLDEVHNVACVMLLCSSDTYYIVEQKYHVFTKNEIVLVFQLRLNFNRF